MIFFEQIVFIIFFCIWFLLTIINQLNYRWVQKVKNYDVFHLLPRWTFFAPNPGVSDYHFVYRYKNGSNDVSAFTEMPLYDSRTISSAIWNSNKRVKKALSDLVMDLNRQCSSLELTEHNVKISFSYIALLNFLSNIPKDSDVTSMQFAILKSEGFIDETKPEIVISSEFHNV